MDTRLPKTVGTDAPANLFRVGGDSSISSMSTINTVVPTKESQKTPEVPATLPDWQQTICLSPKAQGLHATGLPPPYSIRLSANHGDAKASCAQAAAISSASSQASAVEDHSDPETQTYNLIKSELSAYPQGNLLNYSVQKSQAYDAAVHKISRLQQYIKNLEKLERGPHRRTRRWLLLVAVLLALLMIVGWTLAGHWKVERDGLRNEMRSLKGVNGSTLEVQRSISTLVAAATTLTGSGTSTFVTVNVSAERTRTELVSDSVSTTSTSTRREAADSGQGQGLPHGCIDRGGGVVDCVGALEGKDI